MSTMSLGRARGEPRRRRRGPRAAGRGVRPRRGRRRHAGDGRRAARTWGLAEERRGELERAERAPGRAGASCGACSSCAASRAGRRSRCADVRERLGDEAGRPARARRRPASCSLDSEDARGRALSRDKGAAKRVQRRQVRSLRRRTPPSGEPHDDHSHAGRRRDRRAARGRSGAPSSPRATRATTTPARSGTRCSTTSTPRSSSAARARPTSSAPSSSRAARASRSPSAAARTRSPASRPPRASSSTCR